MLRRKLGIFEREPEMSTWKSAKASRVLAALKRIGGAAFTQTMNGTGEFRALAASGSAPRLADTGSGPSFDLPPAPLSGAGSMSSSGSVIGQASAASGSLQIRGFATLGS